jgi:hypothetical protein
MTEDVKVKSSNDSKKASEKASKKTFDRASSSKYLDPWKTLPGLLSMIAAIVMTVAGVIAMFYQSVILPSTRDSSERPVYSSSVQNSSQLPSQLPKSADIKSRAARSNSSERSPSDEVQTLALPNDPKAELTAGEDGTVIYTILSAQLAPFNAENRFLKLTIRCMVDYSYDINFWDRSFRLVIDGAERSPSNSLNQLVAAQSAKEGEIIFSVPTSARFVVLRIGSPGKATAQIPLDLNVKNIR